MGAIIILAPVVVASWPAIAAAVAAAAAGLGLSVKESVKEDLKEELRAETVEVDLSQNQSLSKNMAAGKEIVATKEGVELRVKSDARGRCVVCATGKGKSKAKLEEMASNFAGKITQVYVYNRVMNELRAKGFKVANEEVTKDESIRINVRNEVD